jgi:hypothetical protein
MDFKLNFANMKNAILTTTLIVTSFGIGTYIAYTQNKTPVVELPTLSVDGFDIGDVMEYDIPAGNCALFTYQREGVTLEGCITVANNGKYHRLNMVVIE